MKMVAKHPAETLHRFISASIMLIVAFLFLSGCTATTGHRHYDRHYDRGPSVSIEYHYFPDVHVYYDVHRHVYHYHHAHRGWVTVKKLPHYIHIDKHRHHVMRSRHHQPWKEKHEYKHHRSHYDDHRSQEQHEPPIKHRDKLRQGHDSRYPPMPRRKVRDDKTHRKHEIRHRDDVREQKPGKELRYEPKHQPQKSRHKAYRHNKARPEPRYNGRNDIGEHKVRKGPHHERKNRSQEDEHKEYRINKVQPESHHKDREGRKNRYHRNVRDSNKRHK
jgi:hypothetical protein